MATSKQRTAIAGLSLSAAALVALVSHEGYTDKAVIPVKGDVPTVGFGSTTNADGSKVKMGDTTSPVKALQRTLIYVQKADADIKRCVHAPLSQVEYDFYSNFVYQYGAPTFCTSSIVKSLNQGDYVGACKALLLYRKVGGFDCSTPGNRVCPGVWTRQLERYEACMKEAAQ